MTNAKEATKEKIGNISNMVSSGWNSFYTNVWEYKPEEKKEGEEGD